MNGARRDPRAPAAPAFICGQFPLPRAMTTEPNDKKKLKRELEEAGYAVDGEWSSCSRRSTTRSDAGARIANPPIHSTSPTGSTALVILSSASVATATAMRINGAPGQEVAHVRELVKIFGRQWAKSPDFGYSNPMSLPELLGLLRFAPATRSHSRPPISLHNRNCSGPRSLFCVDP